MKKGPTKIIGQSLSILATIIVLLWASFSYAQKYYPSITVGPLAAGTNIENFFISSANEMMSSLSKNSQPNATSTPAVAGNQTTTASASIPNKTSTKPLAPTVPIVTPRAPTTLSLQTTGTTKFLPFAIAAGSFMSDAWLEDWGQQSFGNGLLTLGASPSTTGATTFLAGSNAWTNYNVDANVTWSSGEAFGMIARAADASDFVYCDFGNGSVGIVEHVGQTQTTLAQAADKDAAAGTTGDFGIRTYGNKVACTIKGQDIVTAAIDASILSHGNFGFTLWDPTIGASRATITGLSVTVQANDTIVLPPPAATSTPATTTTSTASATHALSLPYHETNFANDPAWESTWGMMATSTSGFMGVGANASTTGGEVLLDGSSAWTDYTFAATVQWTKGETFSLITRRVDANDDILCTFNTNGSVTIQRLWNSQSQLIGQGSVANLSTVNDTQVFAEVNGTHVTCGINGSTVTSYLAPQLANGGIGFDTWNPQANDSKIIVKEVSVTRVQ